MRIGRWGNLPIWAALRARADKCQTGHQVGLLEDHPNSRPAIGEGERPGGRLEQPRQDAQQSALAGARRSQYADEFLRLDGEGSRSERVQSAVIVGEGHTQLLNSENWFQICHFAPTT